MKKKIKFAVLLAGVILASSSLLMVNNKPKIDAKIYGKAVTKIAGNKNYPIYHRVSKKGPSGKFTSTSYFKHGQIQSKKYVSTKKETFGIFMSMVDILVGLIRISLLEIKFQWLKVLI